MQQTPRTNPATKSRPRYEDVIVKDFSNEPFFDDDGQDFEVKTIKEERLIDPLPELDDNFGDEEDLPDSDRETECRTQGISRSKCFNR